VTDASSDDGLLTGASIEGVSDGSAAQEAGLREGDVVTRVENEMITSSSSLVATVRGYRPGDTVTLTVVRERSDPLTFDVTLDSDEGSPTS
jgi:putative serine protease PepD